MVKPSDDFFGFVNNEWIEKNPIPPEESRWGSFVVLRVEVEKQLKAILDGLADGSASGGDDPAAKKVRDFYATAMDVAKCNKLGVGPLAGSFAEIDAITSAADALPVLARLHRSGVRAWWVPYVAQDEKNTEVMAFHPYQGGLGLPDRDYYLNDDEKSKTIREKYLSYMRAMLPFAGVGAEASSAIMDVETKLATASMTRVELRDPEKQYNKMAAAEIARATPHLSWPSYFEALAAPMPEYFIVCQPKFMAAVDGLFATLPVGTLKAYLRWNALNGFSVFLDERLERLHFDFYDRTFGGATEMKERWRRVLGVMNSALDELVAQLYVREHFSPAAKQKVNELVDRLFAAYRRRIDALDWMGADTKVKAREKLAAISRKLGYPDKWKDCAALTVGTDSYAENYRRAFTFEFERQMKKIGGPVDRTEWYMSPQTVNACYEPTLNEILFPAAILQAPFFDPDASDAVNFGGIGTVIGHELTHGFDDQGSQFDAKGNLRNWWTPEDRKRFDEKTARLAAQFDEYEPLPGVRVNGKLTLGENLADLGGIAIAYDGLHMGAKVTAESDRKFFTNYAVTERGHSREEYQRLQLQVDPHSPGRYRVNGPMSNLDEFHRAFGSAPGDKLWREPGSRVKVW